MLTVGLGDSGRGWVQFAPTSLSGNEREPGFTVHVALLGGGFISRVTAGENNGKTLRQEFVVLAVVDHALGAAPSDKGLRADFIVPASPITDASRRAIAVWITRRGSLVPIQAAGGWLP